MNGMQGVIVQDGEESVYDISNRTSMTREKVTDDGTDVLDVAELGVAMEAGAEDMPDLSSSPTLEETMMRQKRAREEDEEKAQAAEQEPWVAAPAAGESSSSSSSSPDDDNSDKESEDSSGAAQLKKRRFSWQSAMFKAAGKVGKLQGCDPEGEGLEEGMHWRHTIHATLEPEVAEWSLWIRSVHGRKGGRQARAALRGLGFGSGPADRSGLF